MRQQQEKMNMLGYRRLNIHVCMLYTHTTCTFMNTSMIEIHEKIDKKQVFIPQEFKILVLVAYSNTNTNTGCDCDHVE